MNNKMQPSFSAQEGNFIPAQAARAFRQPLSRRTMLGGLAALAGVGLAGCAALPGQAAPSGNAPSGSVTPTATPTIAPTPTPTPKPQGTVLYTYTGHKERVNAVVWASDGQRLASGSLDTTVQLWDALTGGNGVTHHGYSGIGATVTWAPDGQRLASTDTKVVYGVDFVGIWDAASGKPIKTYSAHTNSPASGPVNGLSWSPNGKYLAAASYDYTVRVWDLTTGKLHFFYSDPQGYLMTCVAWSPDSKYIAFGNDDNGTHNVMVQVWNVASQSRVAIYRGHTKPVQCVAWSPNGKYIVSGANDNTARVWHATTGAPLFTYNGHAAPDDTSSTVISVSWSPDGKRVASGGIDRTVQIWSATSGKQYYKYRGHSAVVYAAVWSPNGQYIASGGDDKTIQVWQAV